MKPEVAKIWVDALRSGEYTQGKQALKFTKAGKCYHCCLGVLCELYDKYNEEKLTETISDNSRRIIAFDGETEILPERVREWAGLLNKRGSFNSGFESLMQFNDTGSSFEDIADVIEQNVKNL